MIELRGIGKTYQMGSTQLVALADINLHIARNEYVALVGPSGSGKSTMMNVLGCLDLPTAGTYMLDGESVANLSEEALKQAPKFKTQEDIQAELEAQQRQQEMDTAPAAGTSGTY